MHKLSGKTCTEIYSSSMTSMAREVYRRYSHVAVGFDGANQARPNQGKASVTATWYVVSIILEAYIVQVLPSPFLVSVLQETGRVVESQGGLGADGALEVSPAGHGPLLDRLARGLLCRHLKRGR